MRVLSSKSATLSRRGVLLLAATAVLSTLTGCGLVSFDVSEDVPPQTIMGSPIGALVPTTLFSLPLNIDLSAETATRGTGPAKSANLSSLTLSISSPGHMPPQDTVVSGKVVVTVHV